VRMECNLTPSICPRVSLRIALQVVARIERSFIEGSSKRVALKTSGGKWIRGKIWDDIKMGIQEGELLMQACLRTRGMTESQFV